MLENLSKYDIILASNSPRRKELLAQMEVNFRVLVRDFDENYPETVKAKNVPEYLAQLKSTVYSDLLQENTMIITADTVVVHNKQILGKPRDEAEAREMLSRLSGNVHKVISAVAITTKNRKTIFSEKTKVLFAHLTADEIDHYIKKYAPLDKAGSYGIQEWIGSVAIERIEGSYQNVMGLPTQRLFQELKAF